MFGLSTLAWRVIGAGAYLAFLYGAYLYVDHKGYNRGHDEVQAEWNADKAERKLAADKQAAEAREKERIANEKTRQAQLSYAQARADLAVALGRMRDLRLCDAQAVPRLEGLRVAGSGQAAMPGAAESPTGTAPDFALAVNPRPAVTFGDALNDTLQCSRLIEWVKAQGMGQ